MIISYPDPDPDHTGRVFSDPDPDSACQEITDLDPKREKVSDPYPQHCLNAVEV